MNKTERQVAAIKNGTVIDHIPAEKTYQVANLLELKALTNPVTIGYNYPSKKIGKKGIIKVSDKYFTNEEISRLSVVAPNVSLCIIKDFEGDENAKLAEYAKTDSPEYKRMVQEIAKQLGLTSLKFAHVEDLVESIGLPKDRVCTHCFDGSSYCHEHDNDPE